MFRKALALPEVVQNVELTGILKELYTDHLELLDKYNEAKEKLNKLGNIDTIEGIKDSEGNEIPFCFNCLYESCVQIPMTFGVVQSGTQDLLSGRVFVPSIYGISCKKCGTKLAMSTKQKKDKNNE